MPTPKGLPKVGEVWELTIRLPGRTVHPRRVVVLERSGGEYWSLKIAEVVERDGEKYWHRDLWVDPAYHLKQGWLKYVGPAGPKTKKSLGLS